MSDVKSNIQNLEAHYTNNPKVERVKFRVVEGPETLPKYHLYDDIDANRRLSAINNDIYCETKTEKKKGAGGFWTLYAGIAAVILAVFAGKKFFK